MLHAVPIPLQPLLPAARRLLTGLGLVVIVLVVYLGTMATRGTNDVESAAVAGWRFATTGSMSLDGLARHDLGTLSDQATDFLWTTTGAGGHEVISRSPGVMVAAIPAYWVWAHVGGHGSAPEAFTLAPAQVTAVFLTGCALLMLWWALEGLVAPATRTLAVAALAFATPVWTISAGGLYTHSVDVFGIGGMAWAAHRDRWWLVGLFGGIALWGRLHMVLVVAILGLVVATLRRRPGIAVRVALPSLVLLALAGLFSHAVFGHWRPTGGYGTPSAYAAHAVEADRLRQITNYVGLLVAPDRGLFVWTPVLLLLPLSVRRVWRETPDWVRALSAGGVVYLVVQGLLNGFSGGSGYFGYRLALETLVCGFPLLTLAATRMGPIARQLIGPLLGLQAGAFAIGAISHGFLVLEDDVWHDNSIWLAVRTVPSIGAFLVLTTLVGHLAGRVWRERRLGSTGRETLTA